jgi:hypothetical protein
MTGKANASNVVFSDSQYRCNDYTSDNDKSSESFFDDDLSDEYEFDHELTSDSKENTID